MITRNFNLYLNAGHSVPLVINVNQYDSGEQWVFTLYNSDGTQYTPSTGAIVGIKSDGLGIINSGSVVDGNVVINETQQMTAAAGKAVFELMIDSQTHGTANFIVLVEPKPGNNADLSESDLSLLQEAIDATSPLPTGGTVGQVLTKTANGSAWSDAGTPTQEQVADAVSDWADEHITVTTGVVIDTSLSVAGAAADAKKTGDEISDLKSAIQQGGSFNAEIKSALDQFTASVLQLAEKVAYIDENGQDYYDDIDDAADALHSAMYPPVNLSSISAVYTQSGTVYDTDSLDDLKTDLVVTAHYSDSTTAVVTNYTLSGTLTAGTSTITVTYGGKTTTFTVTVTADDRPYVFYDYLKGDGNAFIDTGLSAKTYGADSYEKCVTFMFDQTGTETDYPKLFGARNLWSSSGYYVAGDKNNGVQTKLSICCCAATNNYDVSDINGINTVSLKNKVVTINGTDVYTGSSNTTTISNASMPLLLFVDITAATTGGYGAYGSFRLGSQPVKAKIYDFYIKDSNDEYVSHMVPAMRKADSALGMYDSVRDVFYTNANSTGAFTVGND